MTRRAIASATKIIVRADDSAGIIGHACRRPLDLHPPLAATALVPPARLVEWLIAFQFHGDVDIFDTDPVAYISALGETGMAAYHTRLDEIAAPCPPPPGRVAVP